ncbi:MAG: hypothetical protein K0R65_197 [Crocinitomicaceae bacterium]|jgi:hypothetical protein|nr:hypothetical protein [Crocinitomicaceae bacterium]
MTTKKNKSSIYIIISIIVFIPNLSALLVACFVLDPAPVILYVVSGIMILISMIGLIYGVSLRNKTT